MSKKIKKAAAPVKAAKLVIEKPAKKETPAKATPAKKEETCKGIPLILSARSKQFAKGFSSKHDLKVNNQGQLVQAAKFFLTGDDKFYPQSWSKEQKDAYYTMSNEERLATSAALIAAELNRNKRNKDK